jgi:uncharacterized protein (DUF1810 family)
VTFDLDRFIRAHARDFAQALGELQAGRKRGHWIWYIFPQLAGLGSSPMSRTYGLQGVDEAHVYLADPLLRAHLLAASNAVRAHVDREPAAPLATVMGSEIDAVKLVSSMTLFREVARRAGDEEMTLVAEAILAAARKQGFGACEFTLSQLHR